MKKAKSAEAKKGPPETPEAKIARLERELAQKEQDLKILEKPWPSSRDARTR